MAVEWWLNADGMVVGWWWNPDGTAVDEPHCERPLSSMGERGPEPQQQSHTHCELSALVNSAQLSALVSSAQLSALVSSAQLSALVSSAPYRSREVCRPPAPAPRGCDAPCPRACAAVPNAILRGSKSNPPPFAHTPALRYLTLFREDSPPILIALFYDDSTPIHRHLPTRLHCGTGR
eukprot:gene15039-biopygen3204